MPNPADVVGADPILTNLSIAHQPQEYVSEKLFPTIPVVKEAGKFFTLDASRALFRRVDTLRAPRARARLVDWATGTDTYVAEEHAAAAQVDDRERDNATNPIEPDAAATEAATEAVLLGREKAVADLATTSANYPVANVLTLAGATQWSAIATGDPVNDVMVISEAIRANTGKWPNTMILPAAVLAKLRLNAKVIDRIKYTVRQDKILGSDLLSALWGIENVYIAASVENTAAEGAAAVAMSDVWGKDVVIAYVNPTPRIRSISLGYVFQVGTRKTKRWREEAESSDYVQTYEIRDEKIVASGAGGVIKAAIA
jgi:hypothetical protein